MNEVAKTRIDLEVKDLKERGDTISRLMGEILEDMTKSLRETRSRSTCYPLPRSRKSTTP